MMSQLGMDLFISFLLYLWFYYYMYSFIKQLPISRVSTHITVCGNATPDQLYVAAVWLWVQV